MDFRTKFVRLGATRLFRIGLWVVFACSHESHVYVVGDAYGLDCISGDVFEPPGPVQVESKQAPSVTAPAVSECWTKSGTCSRWGFTM